MAEGQRPKGIDGRDPPTLTTESPRRTNLRSSSHLISVVTGARAEAGQRRGTLCGHILRAQSRAHRVGIWRWQLLGALQLWIVEAL